MIRHSSNYPETCIISSCCCDLSQFISLFCIFTRHRLIYNKKTDRHLQLFTELIQIFQSNHTFTQQLQKIRNCFGSSHLYNHTCMFSILLILSHKSQNRPIPAHHCPTVLHILYISVPCIAPAILALFPEAVSSFFLKSPVLFSFL